MLVRGVFGFYFKYDFASRSKFLGTHRRGVLFERDGESGLRLGTSFGILFRYGTAHRNHRSRLREFPLAGITEVSLTPLNSIGS